ncbi:MAG: tyrosine-protein phosphatase [Tepidisphaeraceae bacterium]|jgi:hypothetical protein
MPRWICHLCLPLCAIVLAWTPPLPAQTLPTTQPIQQKVGEQVPSEDPVLKDFHSMGLLNGQLNIYRGACPVRDLGKKMATTHPSPQDLTAADARMQRLYDRGIRTVISFQNPSAPAGDDNKAKATKATVALEQAAAKQVGLTYIPFPISNSGPNSLQTMSDQAVLTWLQSVDTEIFARAKTGGVFFHCTAGHDRTGLVAAYLRIKYDHWPPDQAIAEMRRLGHNWKKFPDATGLSSWHEDHLHAIALILQSHSTTEASP